MKNQKIILIAAMSAMILAIVSAAYSAGCSQEYYCDKDNDGYFGMSVSGTCEGYGCVPEACTTEPGNDCDDNNYFINPGASELCNGIDDNCNLLIDENLVCKDDKKEYPSRAMRIDTLRMNYEESPVVKAGSQLLVDTNLKNIGEDLDKVRIRFTILELGLSRTIGPFHDFYEEDSVHKSVVFDIPENTEPGTYTLRMTVTADDHITRRVHREFNIE